MIKKVETYIRDNRLLKNGSKVVVALSGGADSVTLLLVMQQLNYQVEAAHCNFHLRGEESDRDEAFVRRLCTERGVTLHVTHFHTGEYARLHGISIEMAARELRYRWFEEVRTEAEADAVAVAHHSDDSIETLLLNLLRGTGIRGLQGIRPRNGHIVRPLLCLSRSDIETFLSHEGHDYVTDSTNLHDDYLRNKIVLHLLPLLEDINPAARENLLKTTRHLTAAHAIYAQAIEEASARVSVPGGIHIPTLLSEVEPPTLLFELLHPKGFNSAQTDNIFRSLTGQAGKAFASATHRGGKRPRPAAHRPPRAGGAAPYPTHHSGAL